jgi:ABC-2 type transport system permease protein
MSDLPRKNGWTIAEQSGDATPDRTQRLLNHAVWDSEAAMGVVRSYVVEHLAGQGLWWRRWMSPGSPKPARRRPGRSGSTWAARAGSLFAGPLALIVGALSTGSEYGWGTLKTILTQRPRRPAVLAGKVVALAIVMLLLVVSTFVLDAVASLIVASVESQPVDWSPPAELVRGVAAGWLIVTTWCLAGLLLGMLFRGTALAIGIGLVWSLAVENLVRGSASTLDAVAALDRWMPGTNAGALAAALGVPVQGKPLGAPGITDVVSGPRAALVLTGYAMATTVVAALLLQRRDAS